MNTRKSMSKRTRFEVFKRDGFKCQYCGATPPSATLHVDHIVPVASGGQNDMDNLITSCADCNLGKGAVDLDVAPMSLDEKAALIAEREEQLRGYHEIMEARRQRLEDQIWEVLRTLRPGADSVPRDWHTGVKRFLERLPFHDVLDAMELACSKRLNDRRTFLYFCKVCWNRVTELEGGGE